MNIIKVLKFKKVNGKYVKIPDAPLKYNSTIIKNNNKYKYYIGEKGFNTKKESYEYTKQYITKKCPGDYDTKTK